MNGFRKTAVLVGILFIIGTAAGILSFAAALPLLHAPDSLAQIASGEHRMVTGVLLVLVMGFALAFVPILLHPILKRQNGVLALGYVVFRGAIETVCVLATAICWLFLVAVSREYTAIGAADGFYLQSLGSVLLSGQSFISTLVIIVFSMGALILYYLFYRTELIPRWISVWGLIAILLHFSTAFLTLYGVLDPGMSTLSAVINFPIFLQEMVMAVWLIVKGFNPKAVP